MYTCMNKNGRRFSSNEIYVTIYQVYYFYTVAINSASIANMTARLGMF